MNGKMSILMGPDKFALTVEQARSIFSLLVSQDRYGALGEPFDSLANDLEEWLERFPDEDQE